MGHLCRTCSARCSFGLAYVFRIELAYAYNPINLFATTVIAALPSAHHYVVQSEEEDLAADSFHSQVSPIEMMHGSHCCRECRVQIPYSNFTDMCELWLHLRCLQQCYCALLGRLGSKEEFLPSRNPCSSAHVGHHLSSPRWPVFFITPLCRCCWRFCARTQLKCLGMDCLSSKVPERSAHQTHAARIWVAIEHGRGDARAIWPEWLNC
jgi:hypothetical protein